MQRLDLRVRDGPDEQAHDAESGARMASSATEGGTALHAPPPPPGAPGLRWCVETEREQLHRHRHRRTARRFRRLKLLYSNNPGLIPTGLTAPSS